MRTLTAPALALLQRYNDSTPMAIVFEADLTSPLLLAMARFDLTLGASVYLGARGLGRIEAVSDGPGDRAVLQMEFSGIHPDNVAIALAEPVQGREFRIYTAFFDPVTYTLVQKHRRHTGWLDTMDVARLDGSCVISATGQSADVDFLRASGSLWTDAEQQRLFPGDLGWQYVAAQVDQRVVFPSREYFRK